MTATSNTPAPKRTVARKASPPAAAAKPKSEPAAPAAKAEPAARKQAKKRLRLVRDSFTMPETDLALVAAMKARAVKTGRETKKSEVVRAAIQALAQLDDSALLAALNGLTSIKVGRPKQGS